MSKKSDTARGVLCLWLVVFFVESLTRDTLRPKTDVVIFGMPPEFSGKFRAGLECMAPKHVRQSYVIERSSRKRKPDAHAEHVPEAEVFGARANGSVRRGALNVFQVMPWAGRGLLEEHQSC